MKPVPSAEAAIFDDPFMHNVRLIGAPCPGLRPANGPAETRERAGERVAGIGVQLSANAARCCPVAQLLGGLCKWIGNGRGRAPRIGVGCRRSRRLKVAAPLRWRQAGIGLGFLNLPIVTLGVRLLPRPALQMQQTERPERLQCLSDGSPANPALAAIAP